METRRESLNGFRNICEEYNIQSSYGDDGYGVFYREGELPLANDSTYSRQTALVKFLGTTREITHPATLVHAAHGNLIAKENESGILWLLRQIEIFLFRGNSSLVYSGTGEQWDGLRQQIDATMFLDLEGSPPQEADFEEAANLLAVNYAYPTDAYLGYYPLSDLVKTMYPRHRVNLPAPENGRIGQAVNEIVTQAGLLNLNAARFIERSPVASSSARGPATHVPTAPASMTATPDTASVVGEFDKSQGKLDAQYAYVVTAANRYGESAPTAIVRTTTITGAQALAGADVTITITNSGSVSVPPEYFNIYRSTALDPSDTSPTVASGGYSLILQVPAESQANGGVTPVTASSLKDKNITMPFTEELYIGELDPQVITFRQLAPLMKLDLAVVAPAYRWMILLYGVPLLFATKKWMRITNIGRLGL